MTRHWLMAGLVAAICAVAVAAPAASGGTVNCSGPVAGGTINGNVNVTSGVCDLEGVHVTGNVTVSSSGSLIANNSTIDGNLTIQNDSGSNTICATSIGGNLQVHNNSGSTTIGCPAGKSSVGGNTTINNNTGPVTISNTHVGGNLDCHNDTPSASTGTGGNTVDGSSSGECTKRTTVPCPASGVPRRSRTATRRRPSTCRAAGTAAPSP